jgi:EAL domain-containing protein (putative c-di-GMP-specific phosphodiesterase class I)
MKKVTNLGCNIIQGYYYSKPLSNKVFERYIKEGVLK